MDMLNVGEQVVAVRRWHEVRPIAHLSATNRLTISHSSDTRVSPAGAVVFHDIAPTGGVAYPADILTLKPEEEPRAVSPSRGKVLSGPEGVGR